MSATHAVWPQPSETGCTEKLWLLSAGIQGHVGWASRQPDLVWHNQPTSEGWNWMGCKVSSNLHHSMIWYDSLPHLLSIPQPSQIPMLLSIAHGSASGSGGSLWSSWSSSALTWGNAGLCSQRQLCSSPATKILPCKLKT